MNNFRILMALLVLSTWTWTAQATSSSSEAEEATNSDVEKALSMVEESYVSLADDHVVYYRYQPAAAGKPTVVLVNGLIYAIENQDEYFVELMKNGTGVVQVAYSTQPESLRGLQGEKPFYAKAIYNPLYSLIPPLYGWMQKGLETQDLVDEVMAVVDHLEIEKFSIVTLSYGSIPGIEAAKQNVDRIENLILIAPAVRTSGRYNSYGASRHAWYQALKTSGNAYADFFYDAEIGNTMSLLLSPSKYKFEGVEFDDFYSGVYQMARSSKWFDLKHSVTEVLPATTLFVATLEDAPLYDDQQKFWELMQNNPAKKSLVTFEGSFHAIPGVAPEATAEQTLLALSGKLKAETTVKVGTGNPSKTIRESLLDYSDLTAEAWENAQ